jgi:hypothetical protein
VRTELVPVSVGDQVFYVEVSLPAGGDVSVLDMVGNAVALQEQIGALAGWVGSSLVAALPRTPDRVGVDFGVKFTLKAGKLFSVLAEASGEASVTVRLEWNKTDD